jgi:hypothetical protein
VEDEEAEVLAVSHIESCAPAMSDVGRAPMSEPGSTVVEVAVVVLSVSCFASSSGNPVESDEITLARTLRSYASSFRGG